MPLGTPQGRLCPLQVLGTLAMLCVGAVTVTYLLWQVSRSPTWDQLHQEEGPTRSQGSGSSPAREPHGGQAPQPQPNSCQ